MRRYKSKEIARFKRDVQLTRHRYTSSRYSPTEQLARKRIRNMAKELNKRITSLNKYKQVKSMSKELLYERLKDYNMVTQRGTIKVNLPSDLKEIDYRVIEQSFNLFTRSRSSSAQGIRKIIRQQRENLIQSTSDKEWVSTLSDKQIMDFNRMYSDKAFEQLSRVMSSDDIKTLSEDAARTDQTLDDFISTIEDYIDTTPDVESYRAMTDIYKNYVSKLR